MRKRTTPVALFLTAFCVLAMASASAQAADKPVYGAITIKQGYPLANDIDTIKSNLQLSRATELFLWALPLNAAYAIRDGYLHASGGHYLDVIYSSNFSGSETVVPTLNNETYYAFAFMDLSKGPVVYEQPAADAKGYLFGSLSDVWQVSLTDLGVPKAAPDEGKGGKYLLLPPGYTDAVPKGYLVIKSTSKFVSLGMRSVMIGSGNKQSAIARLRKMKLYPLNNPASAGKYIDIVNKKVDGGLRKGVESFRYMHEYLKSETVTAKDLYMTGMLESLGIEKTKPFPTDKTLLANLEKGAQLGWMTAKQITTEHWEPSIFKDTSFLSVGEAKTWTPDYMAADHLMVDRRAAYFALGCIPPRHMGTSTYYNLGFEDSDRNELDGKKDYKLHLPADVPAKGFWSIIIYSMESFSMIPNKQNRYAISSLDKKIQYNDDKSIDIYFGETAPRGKESNWIPTAGQDFFLGIRFYGPDFSRLGKSWDLKNPELIK
jgi:hypothetical protein